MFPAGWAEVGFPPGFLPEPGGPAETRTDQGGGKPVQLRFAPAGAGPPPPLPPSRPAWNLGEHPIPHNRNAHDPL